MRPRVVWAIVRKDLRDVAGKALMGPVFVVPSVLVLGLPLAAMGMLHLPAAQLDVLPPEALQAFLRSLPPAMATRWAHLPSATVTILALTGYVSAPFFAMAPLELASVVGAASFVAERERRTLEALLYSPATDAELLTGKLCAAVLPGILLTWLLFALFSLTLTLATRRVMPPGWFPLPLWYPWIFLMLPAMVTLMGLVMVLVSTRARTQLGAQQLASTAMLFVMAAFSGLFFGLITLPPATLWLAGLLLVLLDATLLALATRLFARDRLINRL